MEVNTVIENKEHIEKNVEELFNELMIFVGEEKISAINILSICIHLMQIVEKYPKLNGPQKKQLVIKVFELYFAKNGGDPTLMGVLSSFIDTAINIEKGNVEISISPGQVLTCCAGIFSSFSNRKK